MEYEKLDASNVEAKIAVNMGFEWIVLSVEGLVDVSMTDKGQDAVNVEEALPSVTMTGLNTGVVSVVSFVLMASLRTNAVNVAREDWRSQASQILFFHVMMLHLFQDKSLWRINLSMARGWTVGMIFANMDASSETAQFIQKRFAHMDSILQSAKHAVILSLISLMMIGGFLMMKKKLRKPRKPCKPYTPHQ